jgi:flavin reductase (DIM6/NTAB) family NADH-FMN oxidoreductase RutF
MFPTGVNWYLATMSISGYFAEPRWEPLCVVGSHQASKINAQVCISLFSASIVPEKPRLAAILWKSNYTHGLVQATGAFAVTLLQAHQVDLVVPLGLETGRDRDKLAGLDVELSRAGDPYFPGGKGYMDCEVIREMDLGDSTLFVAAVRSESELNAGQPVTWAQALSLLPGDVIQRYNTKFEKDVRWSAERMSWPTAPHK